MILDMAGLQIMLTIFIASANGSILLNYLPQLNSKELTLVGAEKVIS
jgi:hypothetical protein